VLLAGFGYAAHHPARGQFLQGMIAVHIHISPATRSLTLTVHTLFFFPMFIGSSALWTNQDPTYAAPVSTIWRVENVAVKQLDAHMDNHFANMTFAYHVANTGHDLETTGNAPR